jgi:formylmethanofuran dehydrogenase subunit E
MRNRKGSVLAWSAIGSVALVTSSWALTDDKSPLHEAMEKVQAKNAVILKGVRNKVNWTKGQTEVVDSAKEILKLVKEARKETHPAEEAKVPQKKWEDLVDAFLKSGDEFVKTAEAKETDFAAAKKAYGAVSKQCTECHTVFRVEE